MDTQTRNSPNSSYNSNGRHNDSPIHALTLHGLLTAVFRHRALMTISLVGILLGAVLSALIPPTYKAETQILVKHSRVDPVVTSASNNPMLASSTVPEEELNSEGVLLQSDDLLRKVVVACNLHQHFYFWESIFAPTQTDLGPETRIWKAEERLRSHLIVQSVSRTNIIRVTYSSHDPKLAQQVLSTLLAFYMEKHSLVHQPAGQVKFFEDETERYRTSLASAEGRLVDFVRQQPIADPRVATDATLQKLTEFNGELRHIQAEIAETQERMRWLQEGEKATPDRLTTQVRLTDDAPVLQSLKTKLADLHLQREDLLAKFNPSYRPVQKLDKQIADLRSTIAAEQSVPISEKVTDVNPTHQWMDSEMAKVRVDLKGLHAKAEAMNRLVRVYENDARNLGERGIREQTLLRTLKAEEENYLLYVRKREEARISQALDQNGIINVSVAEAPAVPILPTHSRWFMFVLGGVCAAVVSGASFVVAERRDKSFRSPSEIEQLLKVPVLAEFPTLVANPRNGH